MCQNIFLHVLVQQFECILGFVYLALRCVAVSLWFQKQFLFLNKEIKQKNLMKKKHKQVQTGDDNLFD